MRRWILDVRRRQVLNSEVGLRAYKYVIVVNRKAVHLNFFARSDRLGNELRRIRLITDLFISC